MRKMYVSGNRETGRVFLTSGFQAPSSEPNLMRQVDVASHFQSYASGGSILHIFTGEEMSPEQQERLIKGIIENFPVQYMTKTPFLTVCNSCGHKTVGRRNQCPKCSSKDITLWSRPIGYFRPVMRGNVSRDFKDADSLFWLSGRVEDFATRKEVRKEDVEAMVEELFSLV